jgi:hypothetical protein
MNYISKLICIHEFIIHLWKKFSKFANDKIKIFLCLNLYSSVHFLNILFWREHLMSLCQILPWLRENILLLPNKKANKPRRQHRSFQMVSGAYLPSLNHMVPIYLSPINSLVYTIPWSDDFFYCQSNIFCIPLLEIGYVSYVYGLNELIKRLWWRILCMLPQISANSDFYKICFSYKLTKTKELPQWGTSDSLLTDLSLLI